MPTYHFRCVQWFRFSNTLVGLGLDYWSVMMTMDSMLRDPSNLTWLSLAWGVWPSQRFCPGTVIRVSSGRLYNWSGHPLLVWSWCLHTSSTWFIWWKRSCVTHLFTTYVCKINTQLKNDQLRSLNNVFVMHLIGGETECNRSTVDSQWSLDSSCRAADTPPHAVPRRHTWHCYPSRRNSRPQGISCTNTSWPKCQELWE